MKVPFARPSCTGNELAYVREVIESGWLTTGPKVAEFETRFAASVGAAHALAVNSCTAALHLACEAAGVGPGSRVVVPTLTFTATAEVVRYLGGEVILADVDPGTGLLTNETLGQTLELERDIVVVIPVHFAGRAARMRGDTDDPGLLDLCDSRGLRVIEDAAHAFPTSYECQAEGRVGNLDETISCFSFYANKTMTTGEGGMLVTNDSKVAERVRRMRLHGIDRDAWNRFTTDSATWEYDVIAAGYKYNMPDIAAAIGLAQLEQAEEFRSRRQAIVEQYLDRLSGTPGIRLPEVSDSIDDHSWHLFVVMIEDDSPRDRNAFIEDLAERGVGTSVHYKPLHRMSCWSAPKDVTADRYPGAECWWRGCLSLPLFPSMSQAELDHVCDSVISVAAQRPVVSTTS